MGFYRSVCLFLGALSVASSFAPLTLTRVTSASATTSSSTPLTAFPETKHGETLPKFMAAGMIALATVFGPLPMSDTHYPAIPVANAAESRVLGELKGSGLVFKVRRTVQYCRIIITSFAHSDFFQNY